MYTYYCIELTLVNGRSGYAQWGGITSNINESMFFDTYDEAASWMRRNTLRNLYNGVAVDPSRTKVISVSSPRPI